jgi:plasmid stabilization system protein ParE
MNAYRLSHEAASDLTEIIDYIERKAGPRQALAVFDEFLRTFEMLAAHPGRGHRHEHLAEPEARVWGVHSYLVVYWPDETPLGVARIIHGSRDLEIIDIPTSE